MKLKMLIAIAISGLLAASFVSAKPVYQTADDDQSSMQAPGADNSNNMGAMPSAGSPPSAADSQPAADAGAGTGASTDDSTGGDTTTGDQATGDDDY